MKTVADSIRSGGTWGGRHSVLQQLHSLDQLETYVRTRKEKSLRPPKCCRAGSSISTSATICLVLPIIRSSWVPGDQWLPDFIWIQQAIFVGNNTQKLWSNSDFILDYVKRNTTLNLPQSFKSVCSAGLSDCVAMLQKRPLNLS